MISDSRYWLEWALGRAEVGTRQEVCFELACQLRDNRVSYAEAESCMSGYQTAVHTRDDPFTQREALTTLRRVYRTPAREPAGDDTGGIRTRVAKRLSHQERLREDILALARDADWSAIEDKGAPFADALCIPLERYNNDVVLQRLQVAMREGDDKAFLAALALTHHRMILLLSFVRYMRVAAPELVERFFIAAADDCPRDLFEQIGLDYSTLDYEPA